MKDSLRRIVIKYALVIGVLGVWGSWNWVNQTFQVSPEHGVTRLVSLGTPKAVESRRKEVSVLLNDPAVSKNWGLMGTHGKADILANHAWRITQGSRDIVVAIIDTGADIYHPDLRPNIWNNPGETGVDALGRDKSRNGIDDDNNGYVDDAHGWNFVGNNNRLTDNHGHGTHIAGIIGARGGNGIGISGVAPKVSIMILKYYDPKAKGSDNLVNTVKAFKYAVKMKVHIINYSGGGLDFSQPEFDVVKYARDNGILFIAAAGNEYSNSDKSHYYPASYSLDNIVSVTAINTSAQVLKSSNFGAKTVDIAAPGEKIYSTLPNGKYGFMTGTSQATAFVTGVAALIIANNKNFSYQQVKQQILSTADESSTMREKNKTSGKLNSWAALAMQPPIPISGITPQETPIVVPSSELASPLSAFSNSLSNFDNLLDVLRRRQPAQQN